MKTQIKIYIVLLSTLLLAGLFFLIDKNSSSDFLDTDAAWQAVIIPYPQNLNGNSSAGVFSKHKFERQSSYSPNEMTASVRSEKTGIAPSRPSSLVFNPSSSHRWSFKTYSESVEKSTGGYLQNLLVMDAGSRRSNSTETVASTSGTALSSMNSFTANTFMAANSLPTGNDPDDMETGILISPPEGTPVGGGMIVLILMAVGYGLIRVRR